MKQKSGNKDFQEQMLRVHNDCRKKHNTQAVIWSDSLAKQAQAWANKIAKRGKFEHAPAKDRNGQGENISAAGGQDLTANAAIEMWYEEMKDFDFDNVRYNPSCGHFTQVVWSDTKEIGAGKATSKNGMQFVVCRYSPAGNLQNTFAENVKPPAPISDIPQVPTNDSSMLDNYNNLIIPTNTGEVCSRPTFDEDSEKRGNHDKDTKDLCQMTKIVIDTDERRIVLLQGFKFTYKREILTYDITTTKEGPHKPKCQTVKVVQHEPKYKDPYYKSRAYLLQGCSYHIIHHYYN